MKLDTATREEYESLSRDLDRLRDLIDRTNGRLNALAARVGTEPVYSACDAITRVNSAASGVRLPRL